MSTRLLLVLAPLLAIGPALAGPKASPEAGHTVYDAQCLICHGPQGAGDGRAAPGLNPRPTAMNTAAFWSDRTDESLMAGIRRGKPGTSMPPFPAIGRAELEHLVAWLRTLEPSP
ncbi:MAG: cytochrome c [Pseudomonadota bacterium]